MMKTMAALFISNPRDPAPGIAVPARWSLYLGYCSYRPTITSHWAWVLFDEHPPAYDAVNENGSHNFVTYGGMEMFVKTFGRGPTFDVQTTLYVGQAASLLPARMANSGKTSPERIVLRRRDER